MLNVFEFILSTLAVWRVARIVAMEDGPAAAFLHWRSWLTDKPPSWQWVADGFSCVLCLSFWLALPAALVWHGEAWLLAWLSLAGAAALLHRIVG